MSMDNVQGDQLRTDSQRAVSEAALANYEKLAPVWSAATDDGPHNAYLERPMMRSMVPKSLQDRTILDLGCGSGAQCEWLLVEGAEVIGVDLSPSMVEATRLRCGGRGKFFVADATVGVDLMSESVDGITASLVFDYFEDWTDVLLRLRPILRPDGWVAISDGHPSWVIRSGRMNYFETGVLEDVWTKNGVSVANRYWHRPLSAAVEQIAGAGFVVEQIHESRATPEVVARFPELEDAVDQPSFIGYLLRISSRS
jgi:SAM-dependent methyltransferase